MLICLILFMMLNQAPASSVAQPADSVTYTPFKQEIIEAYRESTNFSDVQVEQVGFFSRLLERFLDWFPFLRVDFEISDSVWLTVSIIILVLSLIFFLFKNELSGLFRSGKESKLNSLSFSGKMPTDFVNPETLMARGEYRLAVRSLMLFTLRTLHDAKLIKMHHSKTNHDYRYELIRKPVMEPFLQLNHLYDYVWYGGFEPGKSQLERGFSAYEELKKHCREAS